MLHLQARLVGHVVATRVRGLAQSQLACPPRQGGIADGNLFPFDQFLVDPLQPAVALAIQPPQQIGIDVDLVFPRLWGAAPPRRTTVRTVLRLTFNCRLMAASGTPARCNW